jgi:N utilization substance protein B
MQARRAARELSLILFSQLEKDIEKYKTADFENIVLKSVRTLTSNAKEDLSLATSGLVEIKEYIEEYENNHPDNLKRPFEAQNIPVQIPLTSDMAGKIDAMLNAGEKATAALEIAELTTLSQRVEVREYLEEIVKAFQEHHNGIDGAIKKLAFGWDIERLFKIDKNILRIAIAEIIYVKKAPNKVVIDEALELAKRYSTDDSPSFINGILAKVINLNV